MSLRNSVLLLLAACTPPALAAPADPPVVRTPALDKILAGAVAGEPVTCIDLPRVGSTTTLANPDTIIYRLRSRTYYVNQPAGGCNLRNDPVLVSRTPSTRLCRGDILTVIDRASRFPAGSCGLGPFTPFTRPR